jgi:hypothetical protein
MPTSGVTNAMTAIEPTAAQIGGYVLASHHG